MPLCIIWLDSFSYFHAFILGKKSDLKKKKQKLFSLKIVQYCVK